MTGIFDCHVKGLHSIVLAIYPDGRPRFRMYFTTADHELWKNTSNAFDKLTIGFHPHRADFKLTLIYGELCNINAHLDSFRNGGNLVGEYFYQSKIKDNESSITRIGNKSIKIQEVKWLAIDETLTLPAKQLHTVSVPFQVVSAWIIEEAPETDPDYSSKLYTNNEVFNSSGLYREMYPDQVKHWTNYFSRQIINYFINRY